MSAYTDLIAFQRGPKPCRDRRALSWDRETQMPAGAAEQRSEEIATLEGVLHARRTDARVGDWLAAAQAEDAAGQRMLALIERAYRRSACVPARLATEIARVTSRAQGIWAEARAQEDVARFLPALEQVVALRREGGPGAGGRWLRRRRLRRPARRARAGHGRGPQWPPCSTACAASGGAARGGAARALAAAGAGRSLPAGRQLAIARELAEAFGYDWSRGRLDLTVHPFCSGSGQDVRITTRVVEAEPFNCLYSTIHETGHALYEQGIAEAYRLSRWATACPPACTRARAASARTRSAARAPSPAGCSGACRALRARSA